LGKTLPEYAESDAKEHFDAAFLSRFLRGLLAFKGKLP
tara:strand:- start:208 stop:321 length:114 start_codon:yes stop_codon:yes gene_type:complete